MDFVDQIKALSAKIPTQLAHIKTEAGTRNALVEPFIRALGYDTSDMAEVVPEFGADLDVPGVTKNKKVDYGILRNGKTVILIECKHYTDKLNEGFKQLFYYAVASNCRFGILTNGLIYRFYADLDAPNKLDASPFLEIDMQDLKEPLLEELKGFDQGGTGCRHDAGHCQRTEICGRNATNFDRAARRAQRGVRQVLLSAALRR